MADHTGPTAGSSDDDLFPRPVQPKVFLALWAVLVVLLAALTVVIVMYVNAATTGEL